MSACASKRSDLSNFDPSEVISHYMARHNFKWMKMYYANFFMSIKHSVWQIMRLGKACSPLAAVVSVDYSSISSVEGCAASRSSLHHLQAQQHPTIIREPQSIIDPSK